MHPKDRLFLACSERDVTKESKLNVGGWTVIAEQNLLQRGGRSLKLEPRAIELLLYLAHRPGKVIAAEELLLNHLWRGRVVEDSAIYKRINELRKAFGDDPRDPRYIETIPKRGYRLVAPVASIDSDDATAAATPVPMTEPMAPPALDAKPVEAHLTVLSRERSGYAKRPITYALIGAFVIAIALSLISGQPASSAGSALGRNGASPIAPGSDR